MQHNNMQNQQPYTVTGTNINEVKQLNANSGMSYNEVKNWVARTMGGKGTSAFSDTNIEEVRKKIVGQPDLRKE